MFKTVEGIVNSQGKIELLEDITISEGKKVLITILNPLSEETEPALFSEQSLAEDWNRKEENEAWVHLQ